MHMCATSELDFSSVSSAKKDVNRYRRAADTYVAEIVNYSRVHDKMLLAKHDARNAPIFEREEVREAVIATITRQDFGGSTITHRAIEMTDQVIEATELLEKADKLFKAQNDKFTKTSDAAIESAKKRVSQLNDFNNRLTTSLLNLQKTLGSEAMLRALENADKISAALTLLDTLEKSGRLAKIMDAMQA